MMILKNILVIMTHKTDILCNLYFVAPGLFGSGINIDLVWKNLTCHRFCCDLINSIVTILRFLKKKFF